MPKRHNPVVDNFGPEGSFAGEIFWGDVADRWDQKRRHFRNQELVNGVLQFMEYHGMGPVRPFKAGEIVGAKLREGFHNKAKGMLTRLQSRLKEPAWVKERGFKAHEGVYPSPTTNCICIKCRTSPRAISSRP